jgi:hypothetical protein
LKNGVQDLEKIIHYCELEIKKLKDKKWYQYHQR